MLQSIGQRLSGPRAPKHTEAKGDAGFTLTEVIWALFLLGVVATAALGLFLSGMSSVSDMQRQQAAAAIAATALDQARAVTGNSVNISGTSGLVKGRSHTAVLDHWDELTGVNPDFTADMTLGGSGHPTEAWDVAPSMTEDDQWVPLRTVQTVDNQEYTVNTLVGLCYRLTLAPDVSPTCTQSRTSAEDQVMFRVRVVVQWDPGTGHDNIYAASTLVDPSDDSLWNTAILPYPYDDEFSVVAGGFETNHQLLGNDTFEEVGPLSPYVDLTQPVPAYGSVERGTGESLQNVYFTTPADISGTVTFNYNLRDTAGQISDEAATVMVHIVPGSIDDDLIVEPNSITELNDLLLDNDVGVTNIHPDVRVTTIFPFIDPAVDYFSTEDVPDETMAARAADQAALQAKGISVDGDGNLRFQAPAGDGEVITFSYYLLDSPIDGVGPEYPNTFSPATVTITTQEHPLQVTDGNFAFTSSATDEWHQLDWRTLTGNEDDVQIQVLDVSGGPTDHVLVDGDLAILTQGDVLEFRTSNDNVGVYEIEYVVVSPGGNMSDAATLTVTVGPFSADYSFSIRTGETHEFAVNFLGIPSISTQVSEFSGLTPSCGSVVQSSPYNLLYTAPTGGAATDYPRTCTFQYKLEGSTAPHVPSHDPATVTVTVDW